MTQVTPIQVPLTTGAVRSFQNARVNMAGMEFTGGIKSIKYSRVRERELVYSNSPDPVGKTLGENKYECTVVVLYDWWANLLATVEGELGPGYGDQQFTVFATFVGKNLVTYTDEIIGCTFDSTTADDSAGTQALTREIVLNPIKIKFNGVDDLEDPLVPV